MKNTCLTGLSRRAPGPWRRLTPVIVRNKGRENGTGRSGKSPGIDAFNRRVRALPPVEQMG